MADRSRKPGSPATPVLRLSGRSIVRAVVMLGLTFAALATIAASARVIGWILAAATLAGLLHPSVERLSHRIPPPLALAFVVLVTLGVAVSVGYAVIDDVGKQLHELQRAVPSAARDIERSARFGGAARQAHLAERATTFVDELPSRLRGGDVQQSLRSAATRGVAFLATGVLTIFFLMYGPRLLAAALRQLPEDRQPEARRAGLAVYRRSWHYVSGSLAMSIMAGLLAYGCAVVLRVPGKAPLALWMAMLDPIPLLGVVLGALPLILLAAATTSGPGWVGISVVLVGWQLVEAHWIQKRIEAESLHIGPFVTVAVAMVGLQMYGIGGALVGVVLAVVVAATLDELAGHGPHSSSPSVSSSE